MTVEALRRRRPETLGDLLETYGRELQAVAYLILRDRAEAEDVVVETLLTAFERGGSIRDERALRAWLIRVATNHALAARRRSGRIVRLEVVPDRASIGDLGTDSSTRVVLLDGIADLPLQMRAAVVLRYYADLNVEEVASTLGKSPNTIKAQLQTALDRLRVSLADQVETSLAEARHA
jgi:RNA polymerase sigma-70 factor (ECF subfamily)